MLSLLNRLLTPGKDGSKRPQKAPTCDRQVDSLVGGARAIQDSMRGFTMGENYSLDVVTAHKGVAKDGEVVDITHWLISSNPEVTPEHHSAINVVQTINHMGEQRWVISIGLDEIIGRYQVEHLAGGVRLALMKLALRKLRDDIDITETLATDPDYAANLAVVLMAREDELSKVVEVAKSLAGQCPCCHEPSECGDRFCYYCGQEL